jgi:hypothetical protein
MNQPRPAIFSAISAQRVAFMVRSKSGIRSGVATSIIGPILDPEIEHIERAAPIALP